MATWIIKGLMIAGAAAVGLGSRFVCKMKADNEVEQAAEKIIKKETGLDIDLSPDKDGTKEQLARVRKYNKSVDRKSNKSK